MKRAYPPPRVSEGKVYICVINLQVWIRMGICGDARSYRAWVMLIVLLLIHFIGTGQGAIITDAYPNNGDTVAGITKFYMQDMGSATSAEMYIDGVFVAQMRHSIPPWEWEATIDTRGWSDGFHVVTYKSFGGSTGNDAKSYSIRFDNAPPEVNQAGVSYGPGLQGARNGSMVRVIAHIIDTLSGVSTARVEISSINTSLPVPTFVPMYDDGLHGDQASGDHTYGTDFIYVSSPSGIKTVTLSAMDKVGNNISISIPVQVDNYPPRIRKVEVVYPPGQSSAKTGDEVRILAEIDDTNFIYLTRSTPGPVDVAIVLVNSESLTQPQWIGIEDAVSLFVDSLSDSSRVSLFGSSISGSREDVRMLLPFTSLGDSARDPIDGFIGTGRDVVKHMVKVDDGLHFTYSNGTPGGFSPVWDLIGESATYVINNFRIGSTPGVVAVVPCDDFGPGGKQSGSEIFVPGALPISGSKSHSTWTTRSPSQGAIWGDPQNRVYDRVARLTGVSPQVWDDVVIPDEPVRTGLLRIPIPMMTVSYLLPVQGVNPALPGYISPQAIQSGAPRYVNSYARAYNFTVDYDMLSISQTSPKGVHYYAENAASLATSFMDIRNRLAMLSTSRVGMDAPHGIIEFGANLSSLGYPYLIQMYDDGMHDDGFSGDQVFGTDLIQVGVHETKKVIISVYARDIAGNSNSTQAMILFDNEPPRVEEVLPHYITGNSVRDGGIAYVSARITDYGTVSGVRDVFLEASQVSPRVRMTDDGKGNDAAANDGIYTSSNFTVPLGAPNGKNTLTVSAMDGSGQVTLGYGSILVDNPPPSVRILAPLDGAYLSSSIWIHVNASDERLYTTPVYSISGSPWRSMIPVSNQPWNYTAFLDITTLPEGRHNLSIRTSDSSGNIVIRGVNFTVDHTPPVIVPQIPMNNSVLHGNLTLRVWGWDAIGILVITFRAGSYTIPLTYNAVSGLYEGAFDTVMIPDGSYTANITAIDLSNRVSWIELTIVIDNTPPEVTLISPRPGGVVKGEIPVLVNISDVSGVNATYSVGQMGEKPVTAPWNTSAMADGVYTFRLQVRDMAGHTTLLSVPVTVDNSLPIILPIHVPDEAEHISGVYAVKVKVEDLTLNVTSLSLSTPFSQTLICADYDNVFECNINTKLRKDGNYTLIIRSEDSAGGTALLFRNITIDNTPPRLLITPKPLDILSGDAVFTVKAYDLSPQAVIWIMIDNTTWNLMGFDAKNSEYLHIWHTLPADNGRHAVHFRATDAIGNEVTYSYEYVVDNMQWGWIYFILVLVMITVIAQLLRKEVEVEEVIEEPSPQVIVVQAPVSSPREGETPPQERRTGLSGVLARVAMRRRKERHPPAQAQAEKRGEKGTGQPAGAGVPSTPERKVLSPEERRRILRERAAERRARR